MRRPILLSVLSLAIAGTFAVRHLQKHAGHRAASEVAAAQALSTAGRAVVIHSVADLYLRPAEDAPLADQVLLGDTVTILPSPTSPTFVKVETVEHYQGYVRVTELLPLWPGGTPYAQAHSSNGIAVVRSRFANLFSAASVTQRNPWFAAPLGVRLELADPIDDRWLSVRLPDGRRAFVQRGDVELAAAPQFTAGCVLEQALQYEGTPYLWGGRSTYGIDCSGLSANAYRACGMLIPRDAGPQHDWSVFVNVALGDARPGDLLFFGTASQSDTAAGPVKVTHVGLYLGQDEFIHATTSERPTVHRSRLSDPVWQRILLGIRRHPEMKE